MSGAYREYVYNLNYLVTSWKLGKVYSTPKSIIKSIGHGYTNGSGYFVTRLAI